MIQPARQTTRIIAYSKLQGKKPEVTGSVMRKIRVRISNGTFARLAIYVYVS